jgi:hypothetical protein
VDHEMKLLPLRVAGLIVGWKSSERKRRGDEQQEGLNDGKAVRRTPACRRYGRLRQGERAVIRPTAARGGWRTPRWSA